jgi:hypothetical protein
VKKRKKEEEEEEEKACRVQQGKISITKRS